MFELTPSDRALLESAEEEGARLRELVIGAAPGRVNRPLLMALGEGGLLGRLFPAGDGVPALELCLIRQGLARSLPEAETAFALQGLGSYPIFQSGSPLLRDRWIPGVARGHVVAAFALTEPQAGSDAAALSMVAERDGDGFRLTGEKTYISNAPDADLYTVFARTTAGAGGRGITAFAVAKDRAGLTGEGIPMLSPHPIGRLRFDGVRVESEDVVGEIDQGFGVAMRTLDLFRPSVGAFAVGMAEAALRMATDHARGREAFGRAISEFQAVSHLLAEMALRIEAAKLLVYRAAGTYGKEEHTGLAAAAKLYATEAAHFVVDAAIQIHGARALEEDHPLSHLYREVRAPRIYEGTSEIQRNLIARELLRGHWPI